MKKTIGLILAFSFLLLSKNVWASEIENKKFNILI